MSRPTCLKADMDFFKVLVLEGLDQSGVQVSTSVKNYLTNLLQFYIFSDHLFLEISSSGKKRIKTLAEMYLNGCDSTVNVKNSLKELGDTSLYVSGFFGEYLKRKLISVNYYIEMGQQAYETLADFHSQELFKEMSARFKDLTFVLFYIQKHQSPVPYVMSLMDRYLETGCPKSAEALNKKGINIPFKRKKGDGTFSH